MTEGAFTGFTVTEIDDEQGRTLSPSGELDIAAAPILEAAIGRAQADGVRDMMIDLSGLTFMDSTGLHAIVYTNRLY